MSSEQERPLDRSDILRVATDQQLLVGCMALRLNPDFDQSYFEFIHNGYTFDESEVTFQTTAILEDPNILALDPPIPLKTAADILGSTYAFMMGLVREKHMPSTIIDSQKTIKLTAIEGYLRERIEAAKNVFGS